MKADVVLAGIAFILMVVYLIVEAKDDIVLSKLLRKAANMENG